MTTTRTTPAPAMPALDAQVTLLFVPSRNFWWIQNPATSKDIYSFSVRKQGWTDWGTWYVELERRSERNNISSDTPWVYTRDSADYARAYKRSFSRISIAKGQNMYSSKSLKKSTFLSKRKKDKAGSSYAFGWQDEPKHLLETAGSDRFTISSLSTLSSAVPLATGIFYSNLGALGNIEYGGLASLTFPAASSLWHEGKPTELLDESIFAILLVYADRLFRSVESFPKSLLVQTSRYHHDKDKKAYAEAHPESLKRKPSQHVDSASGGNTYSSSYTPYGFVAPDFGGGHGGGHGGGDGGGGGAAC